MNIIVNGQQRETTAPLTIQALLETLGLNSAGTVVEKNGQIVDRERFGATELTEGDVLEIVRLVGGG